jgi:hypothetical protein
LLNTHIAATRGRVGRWVQVQSFITLTGFGSLNTSKRNAGFYPWHADVYAAGKLMQEDRIIEAQSNGLLPAATLVYLPAITDKNGPWDNVRQQAAKHGYTMPPHSAQARFNHLEISDLADWLAALIKQKNTAPLTRSVLTKPASSKTKWEDYLGKKRLASKPKLAPKAQIKNAIRTSIVTTRAIVLATAWHTGLLPKLATLLNRPTLPPRAPRPAEAPIPNAPYTSFTWLDSLLALRQPYLHKP